MRTRPGRPYPLGATWDGHGVNCSHFSQHATATVKLCLGALTQSAAEFVLVNLEACTAMPMVNETLGWLARERPSRGESTPQSSERPS